MSDDWNGEVADVPIQIHADRETPIYLQIKYQLSYLISSQRLAPGSRLPSVRSMADDLTVNSHTVARAFRELQGDGLIESHAGRGTFVRDFDHATRGHARRIDYLTAAMRAARMRARSLGFTDDQILRHLSMLVSRERSPAVIAFIDDSAAIAGKYAQRIGQHVGDSVHAKGVTIHELRGDPHVLAEAYFVFAFARTVPVLESLLNEHEHEIVTIASHVTPDTVHMLGEFPPDARLTVVTEEHYLHAALQLLTEYSRVGMEQISTITLEGGSALPEELPSCDMLLYSFTVRDQVLDADLAAPAAELRFELSRDSLAKLDAMFPHASVTMGL